MGAGNGGCATAADLTLRGYEVSLYSRSASTLQPIIDRGGIELIEAGKAEFARPKTVTSDLRTVIEKADLVVISAPAVAHETLGREIARSINGRQILLLNPGHTGGSLHMTSVLRAAGSHPEIRMCETVTLTYICRLISPATVEVYRRTAYLRCAAFPGKLTEEIVEVVRGVFPSLVAAHNVMETGLANINAIMHPAGILANAGWIEQTGGDFYFYREGITSSVARMIEAVDRERLAIVKRLGLPPFSFIDIFHQAGLTTEEAHESGSVYEAIHQSAPNRTIKSPPRLDHRYLNEDVGYGLVPMAAIGKMIGVSTPVIDALITLACEANRIDYRQSGLTLSKMGLDGVNSGAFERLLQEGC